MSEMQPSATSVDPPASPRAALRSWRFSPAGSAGLAATTELSGAVIAPGSLVVNSNVKKVQHPTGGVVGELRVRDGDKVQAGDIVVRLDETITQANLAIVVEEPERAPGAPRSARGRARRRRQHPLSGRASHPRKTIPTPPAA